MMNLDILLIEDNEGDIFLTTEALIESGISNSIQIVKDGCEALRYLEKKGEYANAPSPQLILLDINLPKVNGHEVLKKIKKNEVLKHLPVIMLSTSNSTEDITKANQLDADFYITKPLGNDGYTEVVDSIKNFWVKKVKKSKAS